MAIEREQFKAALRRWASGVTVVTTEWGGQRFGMTASAFSSVSIDPPLVLVCPDRRSKTLPFLRMSGVFTVNVLASDQDALSSRFAAAGNEDVRFEGLVCSTGKTGAPRLPGALAALDCRTVSLHDAGRSRDLCGRGDRRRHLRTRGAARLLRRRLPRARGRRTGEECF